MLPRLENAVELLDRPEHDDAELERSLRHIAAVNRWLGGARALRRCLDHLELKHAAALRVLDVGTGSGDVPRMVARWAADRSLDVTITAVDAHPQVLAIARRLCSAFPRIEVLPGDARSLPFPDDAYDLVLISLLLHHFDGDGQLDVLREAGRVSRQWVVVGELQRSRPALIGARLLAATVWRRNRLTRHDGPISVRRAFTARELGTVARRAGLAGAHVSSHPLFRLILRARPARPEPAA